MLYSKKTNQTLRIFYRYLFHRKVRLQRNETTLRTRNNSSGVGVDGIWNDGIRNAFRVCS